MENHTRQSKHQLNSYLVRWQSSFFTPIWHQTQLENGVPFPCTPFLVGFWSLHGWWFWSKLLINHWFTCSTHWHLPAPARTTPRLPPRSRAPRWARLSRPRRQRSAWAQRHKPAPVKKRKRAAASQEFGADHPLKVSHFSQLSNNMVHHSPINYRNLLT